MKRKEKILTIIVLSLAALVLLSIPYVAIRYMKESTERDYLKESFMSGCMADGDSEITKKFCSCSYDSFVREYGVTGTVELAEEYSRTGTFSKDTQRLILTCLLEDR